MTSAYWLHGSCADFIVLDTNPLTCDHDDLLKIEVQRTVVGGQVRYVNSAYDNL